MTAGGRQELHLQLINSLDPDACRGSMGHYLRCTVPSRRTACP